MKVVADRGRGKKRDHTEPLNLLPLLYFYPGGVQKELAVWPSGCKFTTIFWF